MKQKPKPRHKFYSPYDPRAYEKMSEAERENAEWYLDMAQERDREL